ncbi:hypothetical protein B0J14DRAFT_557974 [Halenospora varia]|nr:hypothetical protein B0J14DRAFT_557974 [Halenospora varia]
MRLTNTLIPLLLSFTTVPAFAQTVVDTCPKGDYACLDVINSSQCIEQIIIEKLHNVTKEALVKCVEFEGMSANITGAAKVCAEAISGAGGRKKGIRGGRECGVRANNGK